MSRRAGLRRVILPIDNADDLDDVPAEVREHLDLRPVSRIEEALDLALEVEG